SARSTGGPLARGQFGQHSFSILHPVIADRVGVGCTQSGQLVAALTSNPLSAGKRPRLRLCSGGGSFSRGGSPLHGGWRNVRGAAPGHIRPRSHLQYQRPAIYDVLVREPWPVERLTIQFGGLNVLIPGRHVSGPDRKQLSAAQSDSGFFEKWTSDVIHRAAGTHGIEAHRAQNVPGRVPAAVVIAAEPLWTGAIPDLHDLPNLALGLPGFAGVVV